MGRRLDRGKSEDLQNDFFSMAFEELAVENIKYAFLARFTFWVLQDIRNVSVVFLGDFPFSSKHSNHCLKERV